jgi:hypothetical protein
MNNSYETMHFKVTISKEDTIVVDGAGDNKDIEKRYEYC